MNFKELILSYCNDETRRVLSERTIKTYLCRLPAIDRFFTERFGDASHQELSLENVRTFQRWRDNQVGTIQKEKEMQVFKLLIRRAFNLGLIPGDFSDKIYTYKPERTVRSEAFIDPEIMPTIFEKAKDILNTQQFLAFYLGHATMTRPSELLSIRIKDIDFDTSKIRIRGTKNSEADASIPLSASALSLIKDHIRERTEGLLFEYTYDWLNYIYRRLRKHGVIPEFIGPHKARKNAANLMIHKGVNIKAVMKYGRWKSEKVLMGWYLAASQKQMADAAEVFG